MNNLSEETRKRVCKQSVDSSTVVGRSVVAGSPTHHRRESSSSSGRDVGTALFVRVRVVKENFWLVLKNNKTRAVSAFCDSDEEDRKAKNNANPWGNNTLLPKNLNILAFLMAQMKTLYLELSSACVLG